MGRVAAASPSASPPPVLPSPAAAADDADADAEADADDDADADADGVAQPWPGMKNRFCNRHGTRMSCSGNSCLESDPCSCVSAERGVKEGE